jgi:FkbM family methyltransferase
MRQKLEELFLSSVRLYTFNTPVKKGTFRLFQVALGLCGAKHRAIPVRLRDGRRFVLDLTTGMQETVYFHGEYERFLTEVASTLIIPGDVCLDVGANFGWYTTLMALKCGEDGEVHAFEPMPGAFGDLERNIRLAGSPPNVFHNNVALGDKAGTVPVYLYDDLPTGHASMARNADMPATITDCPMITLDSYLAERSVKQVDFVKVDVEGAELMFLNGAGKLFSQDSPPVIMMEMALATTRNFGYLPDEFIRFIGSRGDYEFYAADEKRERLYPIDGFADDDIGANVFCVPVSAPDHKRAAVRKFLTN